MPRYANGDRVRVLPGATYADGEQFSLGADANGNPLPVEGVEGTVTQADVDADGDIRVLFGGYSDPLYIHQDSVAPPFGPVPYPLTPETIDAYLKGDST